MFLVDYFHRKFQMSYSFVGRYYIKNKPFYTYDYKDYHFKVDMQNGGLYFTRKLISFSGKHLPLDLSLKYSQMHVNVYDNLHTYTGFPRGFKTNYHIVLEYESAYNRYIYEDIDGYKHHFVLANNSTSLYYDSFGSGLMLTVENNGFKVFDDSGNYQLFDQYGRLTIIHKKVTSNYSAEQTIVYSNNSDLKISSISDNYGRTINFTYSSSTIQIAYGNNTVITLYLNNYLLTKISKNIGGSIVEDVVDQSSWFLTNITLASGETFDFSYTDDQVDHFITNIKQDVFEFDYDMTGDKWATVTNARGVSTYYDFSENQSTSQISDNSVNLAYLKINSNITSCIIKDASNNNEITDFYFGANQTSINVNSYYTGGSQVVTNNNLQAKRMYLFIAEIDGNLGQDTFEIRLFDDDSNYLAELIFKGNTKILASPVGIRASTAKSFYLNYNNFAPNSVEIVRARLVPLIGDFKILCSNVDAGGPVFFYGNTPHYLFPTGTVDKLNGNNIASQGHKASSVDFIANEKLFYKCSGVFNFWADSKQTLISNCSNVYVWLKTAKYVGFDNQHGTIALYNWAFNYISDISFYFLEGKDDNSLLIERFSHDSSSFHTGYTSYYFEKEETRFAAGNNGLTSYYDYDENYLLHELNRNDGYKEEIDYDSHGSLVSNTISHTSINQQIKNEYGYDSNDNIIEEERLIGSSIEQIAYGYDSFGNLSSIDYPNQSTKCFHYDSVSGERSLKNRFVSVHFNVEQNNNYIDADSNSYSTNSNSNTYLFNYNAGRLTDVSYNNQNILSISYNAEIYGGVVLYSSETITYSNGNSIYTEFDSFGRIYITNNCLYSYNDNSKLTGIIDAYYSSTYPTILYNYNYFDQIVEVIHRYNNLSVSLNYDIYNRITNKLFTLSTDDVYSISFSYHTAPALERVAKSSTISVDSSTITLNDTLDGFSRLTYQSITFGSHSFTKDITYCVNSSSNRTNYMVSSVLYSTSVNYSKAQPIIDPIINLFEKDLYSYDNVGNIVSITRKLGSLVSHQTDYVYDELSRLNRENNQKLNKSFRCTYNSNGNINFKKEYAYTAGDLPSSPLITHTYSYSSTYPDRLISFDGQTISYDNVGNPILYRGKSLSWIKGSLLSQVIDGSNYIDFDYDGLNQKISKSTNNGTTDYAYIDSQLIIEYRGNKTIKYLYSHQGVIGFVLSGYGSSLNLNGIYLYEKNIQQDIIAIRNINNSIVARYHYDAWGNHKVYKPDGTEETSTSFIGNINPIRYRSYYYDTDLKMYWLTTRYYDPEVGRFISPDHYSYLDYKKLHGINLYAYSRNNPVMYCDPTGHSWLLVLAVVVVGALLLVTLKSDSPTPKGNDKSEVPTGEDAIKYDEDPYEGSDFTVYYGIVENSDEDKYLLQVYESWKFTPKQMREFLEYLQTQYSDMYLNIDKIMNEWAWHNLAFSLDFDRDASRSVDVYFNHDDEDHWFSLILNWRLWY